VEKVRVIILTLSPGSHPTPATQTRTVPSALSTPENEGHRRRIFPPCSGIAPQPRSSNCHVYAGIQTPCEGSTRFQQKEKAIRPKAVRAATWRHGLGQRHLTACTCVDLIDLARSSISRGHRSREGARFEPKGWFLGGSERTHIYVSDASPAADPPLIRRVAEVRLSSIS